MFKLFTMHLRLAKFTGLQHDAVPMHPTHANLRGVSEASACLIENSIAYNSIL